MLQDVVLGIQARDDDDDKLGLIVIGFHLFSQSSKNGLADEVNVGK